MTIWWQKSALIQPRTSFGKSDVSWLGPGVLECRLPMFVAEGLADMLLAAAACGPACSPSQPTTSRSAHRCARSPRRRRKNCSASSALYCHDTSLFPRLVLGWIDADLDDQIVIFQHFSRSTRFSQFCAARI